MIILLMMRSIILNSGDKLSKNNPRCRFNLESFQIKISQKSNILTTFLLCIRLNFSF